MELVILHGSPGDPIEEERLALQSCLDGEKTLAERRALGQFATPAPTAREIVAATVPYLPDRERVRFLEPAIGTGSFYSAVLHALGPECFLEARGYEVDPHYGEPAQELWAGHGLDLRIEDFAAAQPPPEPDRFNLLITSPPARTAVSPSAAQRRTGSISGRRKG